MKLQFTNINELSVETGRWAVSLESIQETHPHPSKQVRREANPPIEDPCLSGLARFAGRGIRKRKFLCTHST